MSDVNKNEEMTKSIDSLIDALFTEESPSQGEEKVEKAASAMDAIVGAPKQAKEEKDPNKNSPTTADAGIAGADEGEEDEKAGKKRGRPNDLSQPSMRDASGASRGSYDASIAQGNSNTSTSEQSQVQPPAHMKKAVEISPEDFELLQKAKADQEKARQEETLRKAREERETLVKAAVEEATRGLRDENAALRKSVDEMSTLIKSMAKKPQARKSVSSIQALEKSFSGPEGERQEAFSKSEMLDVAEELAKAKKIPMECVIELEDTGFIYNPAHRSVLEAALRKRG